MFVLDITKYVFIFDYSNGFYLVRNINQRNMHSIKSIFHRIMLFIE